MFADFIERGRSLNRLKLFPKTKDNVVDGRNARGEVFILPYRGYGGVLRIFQTYEWLNARIERKLERHQQSGEQTGSIFLRRNVQRDTNERVEINPYFKDEQQAYLQVILPFPQDKKEVLTSYTGALVLEYDAHGKLISGIAQAEMPHRTSRNDLIVEEDPKKGITLEQAIARNLEELIPILATADANKLAQHQIFNKTVISSYPDIGPNLTNESLEVRLQRVRESEVKAREVVTRALENITSHYADPMQILDSVGFLEEVAFNILIYSFGSQDFGQQGFEQMAQQQLQSTIIKLMGIFHNYGSLPRDILKFSIDPNRSDRFACSTESRNVNPEAHSGVGTELIESQKFYSVGYDMPIAFNGVEYVFKRTTNGVQLVCNPQTADARISNNHGWTAEFRPNVSQESMDTITNRNAHLRRVKRAVSHDVGARIF